MTSGSNCRHLNKPQTEEARRSIRPAYHGLPVKLQHCHQKPVTPSSNPYSYRRGTHDFYSFLGAESRAPSLRGERNLNDWTKHPDSAVVLCEDSSFFRLLRTRFRAKRPWPIEAPGLGIVTSGLNLYIAPRPMLFGCTVGSGATGQTR
jgi:hypothetical protein